MMIRQLKTFSILGWLVLFGLPGRASQSISLAWNPVTGPGVLGYFLYYGNSAGSHPSRIDVGTNTVCTLADLQEGLTYYFIVTTYNQARIESLPSNEASFIVPAGLPPQLNAVSPGNAPAGSQVFIYGARLGSATSVRFGGITAPFSVSSDSLLIATVPSGAGNGQLSITTPFGAVFTPFTVILYATPANDDFASPQVLTGTAALVPIRTFGAGKQSGEPNHAGNSGGSSLWYRWTAPVAGTYTLDSTGGDFSMLLGVYTGSSVGNLSVVASNKTSGGTYANAISFTASAGVTYKIAVDGLNGTAGNMLLRLLPSTALPIGSPPVILAAPRNQIVAPGDDVYLGIAAIGQPLTFQWLYNGNAIPGATGGLLALRDVTPGQDGNYSVRVSNAYGTVVSEPAAITVLPNPFPKPLFASPVGVGNGGVRLNLALAPNNSYRLQASTNLTSWTTLGTYYAYGTNITCYDPDATNYPRRFYRVVSP